MNTRILILGPAWVGDLIMSHALIRHLKQLHPNALIDVMAPAWSIDVVKRMPEVHEACVMPIGHGQFGLHDRFKIGRQLRQKQYDQAIVLQNSWKSALIPFFAKIPIRTGFLGEYRFGLLNDYRILDKKRWPRMVDRFVALAYPASVSYDPDIHDFLAPQLTTSKTSIDATLKRQGIDSIPPKILGLVPGAAYGEAKRWPADAYADIANAILDEDCAVWLFGSKDDMPILLDIQALTHGRAQVMGDTVSLDQKIDLLALTTCIVSNDSGLLHAAAALNKPVAGIYGPTSSDFAPPLSDDTRIFERYDLACRPCKRRICPLEGEAFMACMKGISPRRVLDWVMEQF